jgi:RNA-directed DNA polymerase
MLTALESGVKGGKWFSLIDKVHSKRNLQSAFEAVKKNKGSAGVDHQTTEKFETRLEENLERIIESLKSRTYQPQPIKRVWIPKPGSSEKRPLGIPTVRDRVVQAALRNVIEPIFERDFAEHSYGFRPGRGCKDALRQVDNLLKAGRAWIVDADLKSYFDRIPLERLMKLIEEKISDSRTLDLIKTYLKQEVMEGMAHWTPERGTPQGAVISPLLANIYLNPLDHMKAEKGYEMVRYADDFVVLCRDEAEAKRALVEIGTWCETNGLTLHPTKTRIVKIGIGIGFDFLGYHFEQRGKWPRGKSMRKLRQTVGAKTKRTNGQSLKVIIEDVNRTLVGWYDYFKHSLYTTYPNVDGYVRGRLRSILRKRQGKKGRGRGTDHQRWPNAYFAEQGLFSLTMAHATDSQSSQR